jgi:phage terminase large subunit-like protein
VFILTTVFGWVKPDGKRRFRRAYIEVPRGNAKSTLSSALALYMLAADGEGGAEVYSLATTRDQARIVFGDAQTMARQSAGFPVPLRRRRRCAQPARAGQRLEVRGALCRRIDTRRAEHSLRLHR